MRGGVNVKHLLLYNPPVSRCQSSRVVPVLSVLTMFALLIASGRLVAAEGGRRQGAVSAAPRNKD